MTTSQQSEDQTSRSHTTMGQRPEPVRVHVINHTHWDREWFLTHEYTTAWIPSLVEGLKVLAAENPSYRFLIDGQTLVIEDLLGTAPEHRDLMAELVGGGTLTMGPIYSQPDWRLITGELHVRNLRLGLEDANRFGPAPDVAWLVDTFGHISQAPQLLARFGIDAAFVWRGVPSMVPAFRWRGSDGTEITTVDLFGGYRNLYGVTKTADIAVRRLVAETEKLAPHYRGTPIPLFDGYDLDTEPEDPVRHYRLNGDVPSSIELVASSPRQYVDEISNVEDAPTIEGELLSGRFGSTFPGTLSTRTYLKLLHHDSEVALHRLAEPLATLAAGRGRPYPAQQFEEAARELLRNGVHDCICGVSIDQVHERMDRSYRRLLDELEASSRESLAGLLAGFAPGRYAVSTTPTPTSSVRRIDGHAIELNTDGIGVEPVGAGHPIQDVGQPQPRFEWDTGRHRVAIDETGVSVDDRRTLGLVVRQEDGDTYSSEPGPVLGACAPTGPPIVESTSAVDAVVSLRCRYEDPARRVDAELRLHLTRTDGPSDGQVVLDVEVVVDSDGTDFLLDLEIDTGIEADSVVASMPFDLVERVHVDEDLLPAEVDPALSAVLMGQREVGRVDEFPHHGLVSLAGPTGTAVVLAAGIRAYRSKPDGLISLPLRRSVEWLAKTGLAHRQGDAGPAMYLPGARCERRICHRIGLALASEALGGLETNVLAAQFFDRPLVVDVAQGPADGRTNWSVAAPQLPMSALEWVDGKPVARFHNPGDQTTTAVTAGPEPGRPSTIEVGPRQIVDVTLAIDELGPSEIATVGVIDGFPRPRVGPSRSRPANDVMRQLSVHHDDLLAQLGAVLDHIDRCDDDLERHRLTHRRYVIEREAAEVELSLELNRRLARAGSDIVSIPDDPDPEIARLGWQLNDLRIGRRIYDYVAQAL